VQRVAELVEQGLGVVERDQHRRAGGAADEVVVVRRDRGQCGAGEGLVATVARWPTRPSACRRARSSRRRTARRSGRRLASTFHTRTSGWNTGTCAGDLGEAQAVQPLGHVERASIMLPSSKYGVELAWSSAYFFAAPSRRSTGSPTARSKPRLPGSFRAIAVMSDLLADARDRRRPHPHHQRVGLGRIDGHRVGHPPVGVGGEAEQLGALGAQPDDVAAISALVSWASP
jgi:hypothetical protein